MSIFLLFLLEINKKSETSIPKTDINFLVIFLLLAHWKVSFRIAINFSSGHFGEEGGQIY